MVFTISLSFLFIVCLASWCTACKLFLLYLYLFYPHTRVYILCIYKYTYKICTRLILCIHIREHVHMYMYIYINIYKQLLIILLVTVLSCNSAQYQYYFQNKTFYFRIMEWSNTKLYVYVCSYEVVLVHPIKLDLIRMKCLFQTQLSIVKQTRDADFI